MCSNDSSKSKFSLLFRLNPKRSLPEKPTSRITHFIPPTLLSTSLAPVRSSRSASHIICPHKRRISFWLVSS